MWRRAENTFAGMPVARSWCRRANTARSMRRCMPGGSTAARTQRSGDTTRAGQSLRTGISPRRNTSFAPCESVLFARGWRSAWITFARWPGRTIRRDSTRTIFSPRAWHATRSRAQGRCRAGIAGRSCNVCNVCSKKSRLDGLCRSILCAFLHAFLQPGSRYNGYGGRESLQLPPKKPPPESRTKFFPEMPGLKIARG